MAAPGHKDGNSEIVDIIQVTYEQLEAKLDGMLNPIPIQCGVHQGVA